MMTALFDTLDEVDRLRDDWARERARYEHEILKREERISKLGAAIAKLYDELIRLDMVEGDLPGDDGAGMVELARLRLLETVQARDYFFDEAHRLHSIQAAAKADETPGAVYWRFEAQQLGKMNRDLLARIHSLKTRLGQVQ